MKELKIQSVVFWVHLSLAFNGALPTSAGRLKRAMESPDGEPWGKNPEIVYRLMNLSSVLEDQIHRAINRINAVTCVRFRESTENIEKYHVRFYNKYARCRSSARGRRNWKRQNFQQIELHENCSSYGTAMHEIMHLLGFIHEHKRPDRDEHIIVLRDNIDPDQWPQFAIAATADTLGQPYDVGSIMHYPPYSRDGKNLEQLRARDPTKAHLMGQRDELSVLDIKKLQAAFCCDPAIGCRNVTLNVPYQAITAKTVAPQTHRVTEVAALVTVPPSPPPSSPVTTETSPKNLQSYRALPRNCRGFFILDREDRRRSCENCSLQDCYILCWDEPSCRGFSYAEAERLCYPKTIDWCEVGPTNADFVFYTITSH